MIIYYPLTLGIASKKPQKDDAAPHKARHDSWREGISPVSDYTEYPEDQILNRIKDSALREKHLSIILGEPGAGKSTLFDNWFKRWSEEHTSVCYGMVVPVLVRFRSLDAETCQRKHADELADYFWAQGINKKALAPTATTDKIYTNAMCRFFRPVWFLDGLDELPDMLLNKDFYEKLVNLPGMKIITCRTAIYQTLRGDAHAYSAQEYHILPITPAHQKAFLIRNGHTEQTAEELHRKIQANSQIRQLAGNPLMLSLIAENGSELPASRAEFYCQAVQNMWHRKLKGNVDLKEFIGAANAVLPRLAEANKLHKIELPLEALTSTLKQEAPDQKAAFEWFKQSGLLTIDDRLGKVSFIHLTFHEYYLAQAWKDKPFYDTLMAHWDDARYEETLGLLCALLFADQNRQNALENALITFVEWGQQTHRDNPEILWGKQRSPLRTALHILRRAAIDVEQLPKLAEFLWERIEGYPLKKYALAGDEGTPDFILDSLAEDERVRRAVARNLSTPQETLAKLAHDKDELVLRFAASNPSIPQETLAKLVRDEDERVRRAVARNPSTPQETLAKLADNKNEWVRRVAASNPSIPQEDLAKLADDTHEWVRQVVAENPSTPRETLAKLADDTHGCVRQTVAGNPSTPRETLAKLADDTHEWVRQTVAGNPSTPQETLAKLAYNTDASVRGNVAGNPSTPQETLAKLAQNPDELGRRALAGNPSMPQETIAKLARDKDELVLIAVAENPSTPQKTLAKLAHDTHEWVRYHVAQNPSIPQETLAKLAHDTHEPVRLTVARNPNTLLEDLGFTEQPDLA